jgi:dolichol-phosphate mannosyltransferase
MTDPTSIRRDAPGLLSVIVPLYNEEETLPELYERLTAVFGEDAVELVLVDDGSRDRTPLLLRELMARDPRVRGFRLSRNFGHQAALTAGLDQAKGDVVVSIDADLQDPPEVIPELLEAWREGADVVFAVRRERPGEPWLRALAIRVFYKAFNRMAKISYSRNAGDFRLMDRTAVDALLRMRESNRFLRGMSAWIGFRQAEVVYDRDVRFAGESKYPLRKLMRLALDALLSFSYVPLRLAAVLGSVMAILAFLAIPVIAVLRLTGQYEVSGIASVHILILAVGGIQLMTLGIIGEYLGRNYDESKARPLYILDPRFGDPDG